MQMFSDELLKRATCQPAKPRWLERMVSWWRRVTGRYRYHMSHDPGCAKGDKGAWCLCRYDNKTGAILDGDPPSAAVAGSDRPPTLITLDGTVCCASRLILLDDRGVYRCACGRKQEALAKQKLDAIGWPNDETLRRRNNP